MHFNPADILFEDNHLLIVNKQPGQLAQGDRTGDETLVDSLKAYLKEKYNKPGEVFLGVVHRLDRPTSGAIIFARTSKALARLNEMLKQRTIKKTYWAITNKLPGAEEGTLKHHLLRHGSANVSKVVSPKHKLGKEAILHYKLLNRQGEYYLLEIDLQTGRHHQIRAQLSAMKSPIVGDLKYGYRKPNKDSSICLHARKIEFVHPVSKEKLSITAPLPKTQPWSLFKNV